MYRIELKAGEEVVFRTIEELATAIRNSLVTPKARIFHNASQKWLPIEFHPHYKKALLMPAMKATETTSGVVPAVPSFVKTAPTAPAPVPAPVVTTAPAPAPRPSPSQAVTPIQAPDHESAQESVATAVIEPPVVASPVVTLPTIKYEPDPLPAMDNSPAEPLPVAHAPLTRASGGRVRPLHLGIAAALLVVGSYVAVSAASTTKKSGPAQAEQTPAAAVVAAAPASTPAIDSAPVKSVAAAEPGAGGPTFGGPAPAEAAKRPIVSSIGATVRTPTPKDSAAEIEPPPADVDLSVPSLPVSDSLAPTTSTDTAAMRRILRAVGGKAVPERP